MTRQPADAHDGSAVVDVNALKTNQALIVGLVAVAFVLGVGAGGAWIVAAVAISLAIGAARPGYGPFQLVYRWGLRAGGLVRPRPRQDYPAPHRFAQAAGAAVLTVAAIALLGGAQRVGWALAWIVVGLAAVNLLFGFCAGCFAFFHLRRAWRRVGGAS